MRSLKARTTIISVYKAGVCSRASGSFKERFRRMGFLAGSSFKYKLHDTKTLNTRGLEPRKLKDKKGKIVTDRQRRGRTST